MGTVRELHVEKRVYDNLGYTCGVRLSTFPFVFPPCFFTTQSAIILSLLSLSLDSILLSSFSRQWRKHPLLSASLPCILFLPSLAPRISRPALPLLYPLFLVFIPLVLFVSHPELPLIRETSSPTILSDSFPGPMVKPVGAPRFLILLLLIA